MFKAQRNWKLGTRNYDVCSARSVLKTFRIIVDDHRRMLSFGGKDFSFRPHLAQVAVIRVGPRFLTEEFVQSPLIISRLLGDFLQQNLHGPGGDFCRCAIFPGHSYYLYLLSLCPANTGLSRLYPTRQKSRFRRSGAAECRSSPGSVATRWRAIRARRVPANGARLRHNGRPRRLTAASGASQGEVR
jgi:hypothetical protein